MSWHTLNDQRQLPLPGGTLLGLTGLRKWCHG